jgi:MoxR-like ATPase
MTIALDPRQEAFLDACIKEGYCSPLKRAQIKAVKAKYGLPMPAWIVNDDSRRSGHGMYEVPEFFDYIARKNNVIMSNDEATEDSVTNTVRRGVEVMNQDIENLIPSAIKTYVPFGAYHIVEKIIKKARFYPVYISGLSGNGKTTMVQQICATNSREFVRASITKETDEDDLVGGFRLINGESVWVDGPAVIAMKRGAILLLDEVNLNPDKIMCLQPVMEGNPIFLKKISRYVYPKQGFNIIATANGKGQGGEDGFDKFIGAQVMNEAFLERFAITIEHDYPDRAIEKKIVMNIMKRENCVDASFADALVKWAETIRKTYKDGGMDDIITTRRLEHIVTAFGIFEDRHEALKMGVARFNPETKQAFIDLYYKIDPPESAVVETGIAVSPTEAVPLDAVVWLNTSYEEKEEVKALGAGWDKYAKKWFVYGAAYTTNPSSFDKYLPYILIRDENTSDTHARNLYGGGLVQSSGESSRVVFAGYHHSNTN